MGYKLELNESDLAYLAPVIELLQKGGGEVWFNSPAETMFVRSLAYSYLYIHNLKPLWMIKHNGTKSLRIVPKMPSKDYNPETKVVAKEGLYPEMSFARKKKADTETEMETEKLLWKPKEKQAFDMLNASPEQAKKALSEQEFELWKELTGRGWNEDE